MTLKSALSRGYRNTIAGFTAAILAFPESIAYGTLAMAPLGREYISFGVIAGLVSLAVINISTAIFNHRSIIISGPFSLTALMLASTLSFILSQSSLYPALTKEHTLALLFLVIFMAGVFQVIFGFMKVGDLAKYIPYPVISGLQNGTAILIFLTQIPTILGLADDLSLSLIWKTLLDSQATLSSLGIQPYTFIVGLATVFVIIVSENIVPKIPAPFVGISMGTGLYLLIQEKVPDVQLGPIIGSIPFQIPEPKYIWEFFALFTVEKNDHIWAITLELMPLAFGISVIVALRSLISLVAIDNLTQERTKSNPELFGQGLGNIISACFGGIACAGSVAYTTASYKYGSDHAISKLASGVFALLVLLLLHSYVAFIPKVVLSAILVILSFTAFDSWVFQLIRQWFSQAGKERRETSVNIFLILLVTTVMLVMGIFEAVAVGIAAAILMFVIRMGKDVVRRQFSGANIRSNVERPLRELKFLEAEGWRIRMLELEGSIFFGTADKVAEIVFDFLKEDIKIIILDFKRVKDIDSTGFHILSQLYRKCVSRDTFLLFSSLELDGQTKNITSEKDQSFESLEDALAWGEDYLIAKNMHHKDKEKKIPLSNIDALSVMTESDLEILNNYLTKKSYHAGDVVFQEGDSGDRVFFIVQGRAHIFVNIGSGVQKRVSTLSVGTIFGEMAMIDGGARSANVIAEADLVCYSLEKDQLRELSQSHPKIAYKVILGVGKELSKRIRTSNSIITQLKN